MLCRAVPHKCEIVAGPYITATSAAAPIAAVCKYREPRMLHVRGRWERALCVLTICLLFHPWRDVQSRPQPLGQEDADQIQQEDVVASNRPEDLFGSMQVLVPEDQYSLSEHFVTTTDGYILRLYRLRDKQKAASGDAADTAPVVLLQHALLDSSAGWLLMGRDKSLAFLLAKQGFDVWMGNVRGNRYSRNHTHLDPDQDAAFWAYSWDHMGLKDLPAMVQGLLQFSGAASLQYIGYSQGTTMALAALSSYPQLASMISQAVLLAPVAFTGHITSLPFNTLARLQTAEVFQKYGLREFGPHDEEAAGYYVRGCRMMPWACIRWLQFLCGANPAGNIDTELLDYLMQYLPAGTSTQNMAHWGQGVRSPSSGPTGLRMFDYGTDCPHGAEQHLQHHQQEWHAHAAGLATLNTVLQHASKDLHVPALPEDAIQGQHSVHDAHSMHSMQTGGNRLHRHQLPEVDVKKQKKRRMVSGSPLATCNQLQYNGRMQPPTYNFSEIVTPLALFTGGQDSLSDPEDVQLLLAALPQRVIRLHHHIDEYAHFDFGLGSDAHARLYPVVIDLLLKHAQTTAAAA